MIFVVYQGRKRLCCQCVLVISCDERGVWGWVEGERWEVGGRGRGENLVHVQLSTTG